MIAPKPTHPSVTTKDEPAAAADLRRIPDCSPSYPSRSTHRPDQQSTIFDMPGWRPVLVHAREAAVERSSTEDRAGMQALTGQLVSGVVEGGAVPERVGTKDVERVGAAEVSVLDQHADGHPDVEPPGD